MNDVLFVAIPFLLALLFSALYLRYEEVQYYLLFGQTLLECARSMASTTVQFDATTKLLPDIETQNSETKLESGRSIKATCQWKILLRHFHSNRYYKLIEQARSAIAFAAIQMFSLGTVSLLYPEQTISTQLILTRAAVILLAPVMCYSVISGHIKEFQEEYRGKLVEAGLVPQHQTLLKLKRPNKPMNPSGGSGVS